MRIGILSDTHDRLERTKVAVELLIQADVGALFHCGDLIGPEILVACSVRPCYFTFGNNDADMVPELRRTADEHGIVCTGWGDVIELGGHRIGIAHGHRRIDLRRILDANPDYLLSGHSHVAHHEQQGTIRRINPGALHRAEQFSVAVLDLETDELRFIPVPR